MIKRKQSISKFKQEIKFIKQSLNFHKVLDEAFFTDYNINSHDVNIYESYHGNRVYRDFCGVIIPL